LYYSLPIIALKEYANIQQYSQTYHLIESHFSITFSGVKTGIFSHFLANLNAEYHIIRLDCATTGSFLTGHFDRLSDQYDHFSNKMVVAANYIIINNKGRSSSTT